MGANVHGHWKTLNVNKGEKDYEWPFWIHYTMGILNYYWLHLAIGNLKFKVYFVVFYSVLVGSSLRTLKVPPLVNFGFQLLSLIISHLEIIRNVKFKILRCVTPCRWG